MLEEERHKMEMEEMARLELEAERLREVGHTCLIGHHVVVISDQ